MLLCQYLEAMVEIVGKANNLHPCPNNLMLGEMETNGFLPVDTYLGR